MPFEGPLFIVGMPRSGTKLLRNLLNQHSQITIVPVESHILPNLIRQFGDPLSLHKPANADRFLTAFMSSPFYDSMARRGAKVSRQDCNHILVAREWTEVFGPIYRKLTPDKCSSTQIWGDKTPMYLGQMPLLKRAFPAAKFIQIIRDPRDNALSAWKAWGKSIYRTADRWRREVTNARKVGRTLEGDYLEVYYERLITDPRVTLSNICEFLDVKFESSVLSLTKPSENLGDTVGQQSIVSSNARKYNHRLSQATVRRIEELVIPAFGDLPYEVEYDVEYRPLSKLSRVILKTWDGAAMMAFRIRDRRNLLGAWYQIRMFASTVRN